MMEETERRRVIQQAYNEEHGITPESVKKQIGDIIQHVASRDHVTVDIGPDAPGTLSGMDLQAHIGQLETKMKEAAANLEFEEAARLRDDIKRLEASELGVAQAPTARPAARAEFQRVKKENARAKAKRLVKAKGQRAR